MLIGENMDVLDIQFEGRTIDGIILTGSLITLHKPHGDEYYIHNGYYQGHSGYHYILHSCRVLKETIKILNL